MSTEDEKSIGDFASTNVEARETRPAPTSRPTEPEVDQRQWSVEEILELATTPAQRAQVCLKASLSARYDDLIEELSPLVELNEDGEVVLKGDGEERSLGDDTAARVESLRAQIEAVRAEMLAFMWRPLFVGLSYDAMLEFNAQNLPEAKKRTDATMIVYNDLLISATITEPRHTPAQVGALRAKIGSKAFALLVKTANTVCATGGIDVPKSLTFSPIHEQE